MKKLIIFSLLSVLLFSPSLSFAEVYPGTCDETAQAIIEGIGGCSGIDCGSFSNICDKCCINNSVPVSIQTLIVYVLIAVVIITLAIWQILKRRKKMNSASRLPDQETPQHE